MPILKKIRILLPVILMPLYGGILMVSCNSFSKPMKFKKYVPATTTVKECMEDLSSKALGQAGYNVNNMKLIDIKQNTLNSARWVIRYRNIACNHINIYAVVIVEKSDFYEAEVFKEH